MPTLSGCPPAPQVERNQLCLRGACDRRLGWGSPWAVSACGGLREAGELTGPPPASPKLQGHLGPALSPQLWITEHGGSCSGTLVCREQLAGVECLYFPVSQAVGHGCLGLGVRGEACPPPSLRAETCGSRCRKNESSEVTRPELLPHACLPAGPGLRTLCITPWSLHGYPWRWAPWSPPPQG